MLFLRLTFDFTSFDSELKKSIDNDQINTAVSQEKQAFITFGIYKLTKNKQYRRRLRRKLTHILTFPVLICHRASKSIAVAL